MKTIKIAHLYYDLMNLYGENGNMRFLKKKLEEQNINATIEFLSINDKINYDKYDLFYIGTGSTENEIIVLKDMLKDKEAIISAIKNKKFFLVTGNALDLFGKTINLEDQEHNAINAFDYIVNIEELRIVGEQNYTSKLVKDPIIGFQNRNSIMLDNSNPLFKVNQGTGSSPKSDSEGIQKYNFYGTYLLGPILVRNPRFTDYLVKELCETLNIKYKGPNKKDVSYKAYEEYLNNFHINKNG